MAVITAGTALAIGAGTAAIGTAVGVAGANKQRRAAQRNKSKAEREIASIKASRHSIINPYAGATNLSGLATDTSVGMGNPFASLGVATSAAEIQIEEADIALANTLDTLRATGASAGGATALAQAALQSKKGVAASIEQQEAANEKARAQGEQQLQQMKTAEAQRMQSIALSEGARVQGAQAQGKAFKFNAQENREAGKLDRVSAQISGAQAREAQAQSDRTSAITGAIGGLTSIAGSYMSAYGTMNAGK